MSHCEFSDLSKDTDTFYFVPHYFSVHYLPVTRRIWYEFCKKKTRECSIRFIR